MSANFKQAYRLAVNGQSVIPLGKDKRPLLSSWKQYQTVAATPEEVQQWWEQWPDANVGLVTGKVSGITVIDVDAYKDGAVDIATFPETYTVKTGNGGMHLYYTYAPGLTISAGAYPQYPHLDIRNDGGFIVAPPSVTSYEKDGKTVGGKYEVAKNIKMAAFPASLFPEVKVKKKLSETVGVQEGGRNDSITSVIGKFLVALPESVWFSEVLPAVIKINQTYNPPLPESELHATFNSVVSLEKNRRIADAAGGEDLDDEGLRQAFIKSKAAGTFAIARYMTKKFDIITIGEKELEMYVYADGKYFQAVNQIIYPEIQRILGPLVTQSAKLETFHKIAGMTMSDRNIFESAPLNFIPLYNGVYDRDTKQLLPHSPKFKFTYQLPIKYDANATCPKTEAFLDQILEPEQRTLWEEWMGYYFHRNYMFKKAIILVGEGDTGKTTLLEVVDFMLGKQNISSISLQKMTSDKFAAAHMFEKHGNLVDELSAKDISDTGNFKVATGGGSISGEYKFGNQFSFHNFSKLTFACNRIPDVADFDDDAYFNRWMVIRFGKTITKKIPNFIKTLTTEEERSGLFNLSMRGLDRLLANGRFTYGKTGYETKIDMMRSGSSIAMFAAECLKQDLGAEITKEDLYEAYTEFCGERELATETIKMVGTKLPFYATYISDGLISSVGSELKGTSRPRGWRNVSIINVKTAAQKVIANAQRSVEEFDQYNDPKYR